MSENKQFFNLYGYQINPMEFQNWMFYQQPYFNYSPFDVFSGNFELNYGSLTVPNSSSYSTSMVPTNFRDRIQSEGPTENMRFNRNENKNRSDKMLKYNSENNNDQKKSPCKSNKHESNVTNVNLSSKSYEILNRNKKGDDEKFKKAFHQSSAIDLEKDFPPISKSFRAEKNIEHEKQLDYRQALQKPKQQVKTEIVEDLKEKTVETKLRAKRKKNKKKKVVKRPIEPFSFVDEDFPSLDNAQQEVLQNSIKIESNDILTISKSVTNSMTKKKRKLLYILPGDLEGQVRIVQSPFVQKNKSKRTVKSERLKKPIGMLNPLDLSAPSVKRGKERLQPRTKKQSKLKKIILLYRKFKKESREKNKIESTTSETTDFNNNEKVVSENKSENLVSKIHSKNFREYCNHMVDNNINSIISQLLKTLVGFQDKLYNRDPLKAKQKRRLCFGLREVTKFVQMKKLRLIIIAPDLEKVETEGGLDDIVSLIIKGARESGIPYVFGLSRSSLAYLCYKKFRVGAIGVFNYDGAESHVKNLLMSVDQAREQYNQIKQIMESISRDLPHLSSSLNFSAHCPNSNYNLPQNSSTVQFNVGHSRTPSNALSEPISDIGEMNKLLFNSIIEDQINVCNIDPETKINSVNTENFEDPNEKDNEEFEDEVIDKYVENILLSVTRLNLKSEVE